MERMITEREYYANEARRLREFAERVCKAMADFQLTYVSIGRECNLDWRIVKRAGQATRINGECERRIEFYLDKLYKQENGRD